MKSPCSAAPNVFIIGLEIPCLRAGMPDCGIQACGIKKIYINT